MATRSLWHDRDYYAESFNAFKARYAKNVREDWVEKVFPGAVVSKIRENDGELRVLGVGSGTGEFDYKLLSQLLKRFPKISNIVCEPAGDHIAKYKTLTDQFPLAGVSSEFHQLTVDEFLDSPSRSAYDVITAIHSLYYVNNLAATVKEMYKSLNYGGAMVIVLTSGDSGLFRLWNQFPQLADEKMRHVSSKSVEKALSDHQIPYEVIRQPFYTDITCCFSEKASREATLLWDFLAHTINFRQTATKELIDAFTKFVESSQCTRQTEDGKWLIDNSWDALVVSKQ